MTLLTRAGRVEALRAASITVSGLHGDHVLPPCTISIGDAANPSDAARACDMLVVTTKAHDIEPSLAPFVGDPAPKAILSMHNGIGASETIRAAMGSLIPVYAASMMIGLARQGLSQVVSTAAASPIMTGPIMTGPILGDPILGDPTSPIERFVAATRGGFLPIRVDPATRETVLFKPLFNTCMNPTGGLTYGQLIGNPGMLGLIVWLANETLAVTEAEYGYRSAATGADFARDTIEKIVSRSTGHRSSMLQDIDAGRRTEIDSLNGAVARLGRSRRGWDVQAAALRKCRHSAKAGPSLPASVGLQALRATRSVRRACDVQASQHCSTQPRDHAIAVAPKLPRQQGEVPGQSFFIWQATGPLALRRTMLPECAADPALGYAKRLPHAQQCIPYI